MISNLTTMVFIRQLVFPLFFFQLNLLFEMSPFIHRLEYKDIKEAGELISEFICVERPFI